MTQIDVDELRKLINEAVEGAITKWSAGVSGDGPVTSASPENEITEVKDDTGVAKRTDQRVVRTPSSGDRVYLLDETAKTRAWVTKGEVLTALGFIQADVEEVDDTKLLSYQMVAPLYKAPDA